MTTTVASALQPLPSGRSVYIAVPPYRAGDSAPAWHGGLVSRFMAAAVPNIITPVVMSESTGTDDEKLFTWEQAARQVASVIVYWIPDGRAADVDFGYDIAIGRCVVLGTPHPLDHGSRLAVFARAHSVPMCIGLTATVSMAAHWVRWGFPA